MSITTYLSNHPIQFLILILIFVLVLALCISIAGLILIAKTYKYNKSTEKILNQIFVGIFSGIIAAYLISNKDLLDIHNILKIDFWINGVIALSGLIFFVGISVYIISIPLRMQKSKYLKKIIKKIKK